jgi:nitrogen fixation/metabolism regulation signal transduction histidine kinase
MAEATSASAAGGRHQRRLRNYLLDRHFQLKYTAYLVGIALVLSVSLGLILWRTNTALVAQSDETVLVAEQVVDRGREVVAESQKVSAVVQMNIVKDPVYSDSPALLAAFQDDARDQDQRLSKQQEELEDQARQLKEHSARLERKQRTVGTALSVILTLLVLGIGLAGIVVTHKVAGPIYKMKGQIQRLGEGHIQIPAPLRKGDELVDFFEAYRTAIISLRKRQEDEIAMLDRAISNLRDKANAEDLHELHALRAEMQGALDT